MSKISVIIPVYNSELFIFECLSSITKQTIFKDLEIILINDGSTDKSYKICREIVDKYDNIVLYSQENAGVSCARYNGYKMASGEYISFIDNDDIISTTMYEELFSMTIDGSEIVCISRENIESSNINSYEWKENIPKISKFSKKEACNAITFIEPFCNNNPLWGKLFKKSFLDNMDFLKYQRKCPTIFMEDVLVTPIIFYHANNVKFNDKIMYLHRENSSSISRSGKLSSFYFEQIYSYDYLLKFLKEKEINASYEYVIETYIKCLLRLYYKMKNSRNENIYVLDDVEIYFSEYYSDFLKYCHNNILKLNLRLFNFSHITWYLTFGFLYFKVRPILRNSKCRN